MESEKVKEIKNNLNTEIKLAELNKTRFTELISVDLIKDILTLINELESENERLKILLAQANAGIVNCSGCKLVELNAVKEFAERLKEKFYYVFGNEYEQSVSGFDTKVLIEHIDETLKEFIND